MFAWLTPSSCPCDSAAKTWVEKRLRWLEGQFDDHAFNGRRIVLPTPEFFPDPYDGSTACVRALLDRICGYMDVDPDRIELKAIPRKNRIHLENEAGQAISTGPAGTYSPGNERDTIHLCPEELVDPIHAVGTLAHELAHVRLL